jgi:WD40 repeat protein
MRHPGQFGGSTSYWWKSSWPPGVEGGGRATPRGERAPGSRRHLVQAVLRPILLASCLTGCATVGFGTSDVAELLGASTNLGYTASERGVALVVQEAPPAPIVSVAVSKDGRWLATGDSLGQVRVYDYPARRVRFAAQSGGRATESPQVVLSSSGSRMLSVGPNAIQVWNVDRGIVSGVLVPHDQRGVLHGAGFLSDDRFVFTCGSSNPIRLWRATDFALLQEVRLRGMGGSSSAWMSCAASEGELVTHSRRMSSHALSRYALDVEHGSHIERVSRAPLSDPPDWRGDGFFKVALAAEADVLATVEGSHVYVREPTLEPRCTIDFAGINVAYVAVSTDGLRLATATASSQTARVHPSEESLLTVAPSRWTIGLYNTNDCALESEAPVDDTRGLTFHPSGDLVVYGANGLQVLGPDSMPRAPFPGSRLGVDSLAFISPRELTVHTEGASSELVLDLRTGRVRTGGPPPALVQESALPGFTRGAYAGVHTLIDSRPAHTGFDAPPLIFPGPPQTWTMSADERLLAVAVGGAVFVHVLGREGQVLARVVYEIYPTADTTDFDVLAYNEAGVFTGDEGTFGRVWFRIGGVLSGDLVNVDQLFEAYHRSDLLDRLLRGLETPPPQDAGLPPSVVILPGTPAHTDTEMVTVRVRTGDRGGGVSETRLYANGARVGGATTINRQTGAVQDSTQQGRSLAIRNRETLAIAPEEVAVDVGESIETFEVPLAPGPNRITAHAYSARGRVRGAEQEFTVHREAAAEEHRATLHLLTVAISAHPDDRLSLAFPERDAAAIGEALGAQQGLVFDEVLWTQVHGGGASVGRVREAMSAIAGNAGPEDTLVVYVASHGAVIVCDATADYHVVLAGAAADNPCVGSLSSADLLTLVASVPAQRKLLLLDTCQAGAVVTHASLTELGARQQDDGIRAARAAGVTLIAGAAANQRAFEDDSLEHGLFTESLLRGLQHATGSDGESISVSELVRYVSRRLPILSQRHAETAQTPVFGSAGADFIIAQRRVGAP